MGGQLSEAMAILCMGRSRKAVLAEAATIAAATPALWLAACMIAAGVPLP